MIQDIADHNRIITAAKVDFLLLVKFSFFNGSMNSFTRAIMAVFPYIKWIDGLSEN